MEKRVLPAWPRLDAWALFCVMLALPSRLVIAMALLFVTQGMTFQRLAFVSSAYAAALASGTDTVWLITRLWTLAALSVALVVRGSLAVQASEMVFAAIIVHGRFGLKSVRPLVSPDAPLWEQHAAQFIVMVAAVTLATTRTLPIISRYRQPLWTLIARTWYSVSGLGMPLTAIRYDSDLPIRFVGSTMIGLVSSSSADQSKSHDDRVFVNGQSWSNIQRSSNVMVIQGLDPSSTYQISLGKSRNFFTVSTLEDDEMDTNAGTGDCQEVTYDHRTKLDGKPDERKLRRDMARQLAQLRAERDSLAAKIERAGRGDVRMHRRAQTLREQNRLLNEELRVAEASSAAAAETDCSEPPSSAIDENGDGSELDAELKRVELMLDTAQQQWNADLRTRESEIGRLRQRIVRRREQVDRLRAEEAETRQRATASVKQLRSRHSLAAAARKNRRDRLEQEFAASIRRLDDGVQQVAQRSALVREAASQW